MQIAVPRIPQTRASQFDRLERVRAIAPTLSSKAREGEDLTHLSDVALTTMKSEGLLHLLLPQELGGEQLGYVDAMELLELLAAADGAAGWYAMVANAAAASVGAFLPDRGAERIYGADPRAMVAGQGGPRGTAKQVEGGYLVNGPWAYGSTIYHADYFHSGCVVTDGNGAIATESDGKPRAIVCHFPKEQGKLAGNWDTLGLRGTGSYDYDVATVDLFVPEHMTFPFTAGLPQRGGAQFSIGIVGITAWCHAAWALGPPRRALDELRIVAANGSDRAASLANSESFRLVYADAEAKYRSARAFIYEVWRDIDATLLGGGSVPFHQLTLARMAMRHIHDVGSEITLFAYRAAGGAALRAGPLQRVFRDMHSATQHMLVADQIYQECGRVMLGQVGPTAQWAGPRIVEHAGPRP